MERLVIGSLPLPRIYIARGKKDINECRSNGIPYIYWKGDTKKLVKLVLYPILKNMFPHIKWENELGIHRYDGVFVHKPINRGIDEKHGNPYENTVQFNDVIEYQDKAYDDISQMDEDEFAGHGAVDNGSTHTRIMHDNQMNYGYCTESVTDAIGDISAYVDLSEIQKLGLLPTWIGEIHEVIKRNLDDYMWQEGWNRKLGCSVGNYHASQQAPNLLIIDVSASIPPGIAATMLALAGTLREQCNADLIVTGKTSGWYPLDHDLPTAQELRAAHGRSNEADMFNAILKEKVLGREWGNVISFGDDDCPAKCKWWDVLSCGNLDDYKKEECNSVRRTGVTKVHHLYSYHTHDYGEYPAVTGYAQWVVDVCPDVIITHNSDWVRSMK